MLSFLWSSPLGIAVGVFTTILILALLFVAGNVVLAFTGGPGPCTAGNPPITTNAANAQIFDDKWMALNDSLDNGIAASANFTESEVSSFVDREIGSPFKDPRICIHDGFGEGTAKLEFLGLDVKIKVTGNVDLTGEHPEAVIDDIEVGNVPGFIADFVEGFLDSETDKVDLDHTFTSIPTEGNAQIDGVP